MAANYHVVLEEKASWLQPGNLRSSRQYQNSVQSPTAREPLFQNSEFRNSKPQLRKIYHKNWAAWRHEMQTIFLDYPNKSCGTGFFLPRSVETDFQLTNKSDMRRTSEISKNKINGNKKSQGSVANKTSSSSHYIYLPKEWTY